MFVNSETGRRSRGVSCNEDDSRTDLDTAASALLHDPHMKNNTRLTEWARLFSRTPQYWLELRLYCDGSRIQANIHVINQLLPGLYEAASEVLRESLSVQRTDTVQSMMAGVQKPAHDASYGSHVTLCGTVSLVRSYRHGPVHDGRCAKAGARCILW